MQEFVELAEVWRGRAIESVHFGAAAVVDPAGRIVASWGDPRCSTYPRSALKPVQAIPLVESGALDALGLGDRELALACASHRGEAEQLAIVSRWLEGLDLEEHTLVCGLELPRDPSAAEAHLRAGKPRSRLLHNCSGKHCGFLTVARRLGAPAASYDDLAHPAQRLFVAALSDLIGRDAGELPWATDGCGLPAAALTLHDMATCAARMSSGGAGGRGRAVRRILSAMRAHPELLSGREQPPEIIARATRGRLIVKGGAEAFMLGFLPEHGLGIALKIADGNSRARALVMNEIVADLRLFDDSVCDSLRAQLAVKVVDSRGGAVGEVRALRLSP
jgi:L-asparaginase II